MEHVDVTIVVPANCPNKGGTDSEIVGGDKRSWHSWKDWADQRDVAGPPNRDRVLIYIMFVICESPSRETRSIMCEML